MADRRLIGTVPKIGIRPTIDGRRRGVRESLEDQTMNLARSVAEFLQGNLRHANGLPIECVIADTTIGGVAEAARTAAKFAREGVGVSLTVTPCWCYGSETMDMDPLTPKAVWGFNGTERPGAVYLAAVLAAHNQKGLPAFGIYGRDVQDAGDDSIPADVQEKLLRFAKAGLAVARMRGKFQGRGAGAASDLKNSMIGAEVGAGAGEGFLIGIPDHIHAEGLHFRITGMEQFEDPEQRAVVQRVGSLLDQKIEGASG